MTNQEKLFESNYVVYDTATLKDVMEAITYNHRGCVVVVDQHGHVMGVASDGDIRRAMVKGATMVTPVEKVVNMNFLVVKEGDVKDAESFFAANPDKNVVPVTDGENKLVDILIRGGMYQGK